MEKPVIILGGGIWGSLLAWRMHQVLPHLKFKLYEETSDLANYQSVFFRQSDCEEAFSWIRPLISQSWNQHQIKISGLEKWISNPVHLISSKHLNERIMSALGPQIIKTNNKISTEIALQEGSFVIDARNICHYKRKAFRKFLSLEIELTHDHNLITPVIFDDRFTQDQSYHYLHYLPLSARKILVKQVWFSKREEMNLEKLHEELNHSLSVMGWNNKRVIKEECGIADLPLSSPVIRQEGRVINLAGIFHDLTGCPIPTATKLIDQMVKTSFRFGELKQVVTHFRKDYERNGRFLRLLNQILINENQHQVFKAIYHRPSPLMERFFQGRLSFLDRSRIMAGKSHRLGNLFNLFALSPLAPGVLWPREKNV
jgi:lycopene beta-cyclase